MAHSLAVLLFAGGFLVLMFGAAVRLMAGARPRTRRQPLDPRERALAILNERYALGEIGRDEYLERRAFLE